MKNKYTDIVSILALFSLGFYIYMMALSKTWMVPGIDGPYYVVQVNYLLSYGTLKYQDPPLVFYVFSLITLIVGDPFLGVKIGVSLLTSLASIPVYLLFKRLTGSRVAGFTAGLVFLFAPQTFRLLGDFMKNSSGLLWLNLYLYLLYLCLEGKKWKVQILAVISLILTALTHILDYGVALLYTYIIVALVAILKLKTKSIALPVFASLFSLLLFFTIPAVVGGDVFKGVKFIADLIEQDYSKMGPMRGEWFILSWFAAGALFLHSIIAYTRKEKSKSVVSFASAFVMLALNLPLLPRNWLFRFQLMTPVPMSHAFGFVTGGFKDKTQEIAALLLAIGIIGVLALPAFYSVRPSIPEEAYIELKHVVKDIVPSLSGDHCLVVPNPRIRYWVETLEEEVFRKPNCASPILIIEVRAKPPPVKGRIVYKGKFIIAVTPR